MLPQPEVHFLQRTKQNRGGFAENFLTHIGQPGPVARDHFQIPRIAWVAQGWLKEKDPVTLGASYKIIFQEALGSPFPLRQKDRSTTLTPEALRDELAGCLLHRSQAFSLLGQPPKAPSSTS